MLNKAQKFYIEQNLDKFNIAKLVKDTNSTTQTVDRYIKKLLKNKSVDVSIPIETPVVSPTKPVETLMDTSLAKNKKYGMVAMTEGASQQADEIRPRGNMGKYSRYIHRPKGNVSKNK